MALELDYFMRKNGAEGSAFQTIAVAGENSSLPHGVPGDRPLRSGDFITMDFGAMADGYCSDMTRTVAIGGVSDLMRLVYETVLEAQSRAFARICAGVKGSDVDRVARDYIAEAGFDGCFGHGLGHSLGIEIHEPPAFSRACAEPIPEGSVLSVEPGIYLEGRFGVRIEDIVLVTEHGFENLTHSPKELFVR